MLVSIFVWRMYHERHRAFSWSLRERGRWSSAQNLHWSWKKEFTNLSKSKEEVLQLACMDENCTSCSLNSHEASQICMLRPHMAHLHENGDSVIDTRSFRFTSITFIRWYNFACHVNWSNNRSPNLRELIDNHDKIWCAEPECKDPESFTPEKSRSSKTSKQSSSPSSDDFFALDN